MAARTALVSLDQSAVSELARRAAMDGTVPIVHYVLDGSIGSAQSTIAVCHLIYTRLGGFMLSIPDMDQIQDSMANLGEAGGPQAIFGRADVEMVSTRGRDLGTLPVRLVDVPWELVDHFSRPGNARGQLPRGATVLQSKVQTTIALPVRESLLAGADHWVGSAEMAEDTAQEYLTGEELIEEADPLDPPEEGEPVSAEVVQNLLNRIAELEAMAKQPAQPPQMPAPPRAASQAKAPPLVNLQGQGLTDANWSRLHQLAGPPPPRVGSAELRRASASPQTAAQDSALVAIEKEAEEEELNAEAFNQLVASSQDPLQQMLAVQLQQNQMLLRKLAPRHADPVLGALAGGGDNASGGGSNVKGCLAREAFLKTVNDLPRVAAIARANALKELGYSADREDGALMKRYIERRIPLAEFRQLALVATMLGEAWSVGYASQNQELLGVVARMLFFVEQTALDGGKSQFSWLLSGYPEPSFHMLMTSKKRPGLQPFSRLCAPAWVSGNLAYLRDLDFMESRMATVGKPGKGSTHDDEADPKPSRQPKAKQPAKGKGKKSNQSSSAAETDTA